MSDSVFFDGFIGQASLFAALADETRLSLVAKLCQVTKQSISQLAEGSRLTRQAVTKHLKVLENVGLVRSVKKGRETLFEFDSGPIETMAEYLNLVSKQWGTKLSDLQRFLGE